MDKTLVRKLNQLDDLTNIIFSALNLSPTTHSLWVTQDNHRLNIVTSDSILATKIRLDTTNIIKYINNNSSLLIREINLKLSHLEQSRPPIQKKIPPLSATAAHNIALIAKTIDDKDLRESLLSIANTKK